ncbi:MAG: carboxypeptidase-like regulatory domain-containing protein, partial [Armatimonadota bacterium]
MRKVCLVLTALAAVGALASACSAQRPVVTTLAKAEEGPPAPVKGVVVDSKGKPVPKARVVAICLNEDFMEKPLIETVPLDKSGRFSFTPKDRSGIGYHYLAATAEGYACGSA